jgi:hypothetical protein
VEPMEVRHHAPADLLETHPEGRRRPTEGEAGRVIYFIGTDDGYVKIGFCAGRFQGADAPEVRNRFCSLQGSNPHELRVLAVIPGEPQNERWIHRKFRHLHHRREWFRGAPDLMAYIEKMKRADAVILGISSTLGVPRYHWRHGPRASGSPEAP